MIDLNLSLWIRINKNGGSKQKRFLGEVFLDFVDMLNFKCTDVSDFMTF